MRLRNQVCQLASVGAILIGTQGWNYAQWVGPFYPAHTRPEDFLRVYARAFPTVEVDSTFYAIPAERTVRSWAERVPGVFRFALKMPRVVTHERRLVGCRDVVTEFTDRARALGSCLGPILIQLGPEVGLERLPALERFLPLLPSDLRFALEFRRRSWLARPVLALLRTHGVALALVEGPWLPRAAMMRAAAAPTADVAYVRLMGPDRSISEFDRVQVDRSDELGTWASALAALSERMQAVYVYVNNHFEGHSPASARRLQALVNIPVVEPHQLAEQTELF